MSEAVDIEKLKQLARGATPGPWEHLPEDDALAGEIQNTDGKYVGLISEFDWQYPNGSFIAAANPTAILALLERLEKAEAVHMAASGPIAAGAEVVAMDARRAREMAAILRDLAAFDPNDGGDGGLCRCCFCGCLMEYDMVQDRQPEPHRSDCLWLRAWLGGQGLFGEDPR
jgi:hypothetical protein